MRLLDIENVALDGNEYIFENPRIRQVRDLYMRHLGREPDAAGLEFYSNPNFSIEQIEADIAGSQEAKSYMDSLPDYFKTNPDVLAAYQQNPYGQTPEQFAYRHFRDYGQSEGRVAPEGYSPSKVIDRPSGGFLGRLMDDVLGLDPSGGGIYKVARDVLGDKIADDILGLDPSGRGAVQAINAAVPALLAATALGPAGLGLSTPVAAATGSGLTTLARTGGDIEAALKAAALSGAVAYGLENLTPEVQSLLSDTADDVAQNMTVSEVVETLSGQGVRPENIADVLKITHGVGSDAPALVADILASTPTAASTIGQVVVTGAPTSLLSQAAPVTAGLIGTQIQPTEPAQSVQVQTTTAPSETQAPVAAATGGLLAPTQTVPVQSATTPAQTQETAPAAATGGLLAPAQTVPVQATNIPAQTQTTAPVAAAVGTLAPVQTVPVEDRIIKREEPQVYVSTPAGMVTTPRGEIPVSEVKLPPGQPSTETPGTLPLLGLVGLGAAGAGLLNQEDEVPFDQAAYDAIAKGRSPVYSQGEFTSMFKPGGVGMYQIAPTSIYDYFGPYYGAGRFGARVQPFILPGLLGATPTMSIPVTPSRGASI